MLQTKLFRYTFFDILIQLWRKSLRSFVLDFHSKC
jgi:hypothetical protein